MLEKLLGPEIRELIATGDDETLAEVLDRWLPVDVAALLQTLPEEETVAAMRLLKGPQEVHVFEYLDRQTQIRLLEQLSNDRTAHLLNDMSPDDRTALLEECEPEQAERFLTLMSAEQRSVATSLLQYPEDSVGRLMTPDYVACREHWTILHLLDYVRHHGKDSETLNVVYVVDSAHRLIDDIRMRQVLVAPLERTVHDLMDRTFIALTVMDDKRAAVDIFRRYDRTALPVVDADGVLRGILTIDDVLDIAEEVATSEMQKLGGLEALEDSYTETPLTTMVRKRAIWLMVLFLGETMTAMAMGYFEKELEKAVVLALFIPLVISSGGNTGSQASTLMVRALALQEVRLGDWLYVFRRELLAGLLLGAILGIMGFLRIAIWSLIWDSYGEHWFMLACTVGLSLLGVVMWGALSGSMLPFALKRFALDPATSSAPFVATLVDVTGLVIYFTVAIMLLRGLML